MLSLESKKLYKILEISSIFVGVIMTLYYFYPVFASPPSTPYAPGETTNPTCSPGDTNCTVYPPLTTTLTTSTAIIMGTSSLRLAYDSTNYASFTVSSDGGLTIASTNAATTTFSNKIAFASLSIQGTAGTNPFIVNSSTGVSLFTILQNGSVGIGTSTSAYKLAVSGTTYIADLITKGPIVDVRAYGATNDASTDSTAAIQAAIDAAYLNLGNAVGGIVYIPAGIYYVSATLNITNSRIHIYGAGKNATFITFNPGSAGLPVFHFNGGAGVLFQDSISDLSINGQGGLQKIGIQLTDTSEMLVEDVSMLYMNGNSSVGIKLRGREMTTLNRITLSADRPLVISDNPNSTIDVDHLHVQDAYLIASGTNPNITIESGVNLSNVVFDGTQAWVLGGHGLQWIDTSTVATSQDLTIKNVRWEQSTNAPGYFIDIEHNVNLQNLMLENLYGGLNTNGIKLRRVDWVSIEHFIYPDASKTALDVNSTTLPLVLKNLFFQVGSTSTFGGLTPVMDTGRDTLGGTTIALAVYDSPSATSVTTLNRLSVGTSTPNANPFSVVSSSAAGGSMLSLLTNGRFGINSSSPIASLAIQGTSGSNPFFINSSTGSSLLSVLQNGYVGIGTVTPGKLLELYANDGTAPELKINSAYTTHSQGVSNTGYIRFAGLVAPGGNNNVEDKFLMGLRSGTLNTAWDFVIRDTVAGADRLVINQNGDVSIGTTTAITASLTLQGRGGINPFIINSSTGGAMLNVLTNGNVGIGVTTPVAKLQIISANSGGVDDITFSNDAAGNYRNGIRNLQSSGSAGGNIMEFVVGNGTVAGEGPVMYLFGDGRVGISTTTPPAQLSIYRPLATSTPSFDISSSTGLSMFRVVANGSVGINSTSPIASLALQGTGGTNPFSINSSTGASLLNVLTNGNVGIGTSTPTSAFAVVGTTTIDGRIYVGDGTQALPSFSFINDTDTGFYSVAANTIMAVAGGGNSVQFSNGGFTTGGSGTAALPAITLGGDTDTGIWAPGANTLGFATNGVNRFTVSTTALTINSANIPGFNVGIGTSTPIATFAIQGNTSSNPFTVNSSTGSSLLSVLQNGNVGIGTSTPNTTFDVNGTIQSNVRFLASSGSSGVTSYSFTNDLDTGFYNPSDGNILLVQNGGLAFYWTATALQLASNRNLSWSNTAADASTVQDVGLSRGAAGALYVGTGAAGSFAGTLVASSTLIGTSTSIAKLTLQGTGANNPFSIVSSTAAASSMFTVLTNGNIGINSSSPIASLALQGTGGTNPFSINSSTGSVLLNVLTNGNVGIGAATPAAKLNIVSANSAITNDLMFTNDGSGNYRNGIANKQIAGDAATNLMVFYVGDGTVSGQTRVMDLTGNGRVGIGTSTPLAKLTVVGSGNTSTTLAFNTFSASGTSTFKIDDAGNASFANDGLYYEASSSVSYINSFETGGLNFDDNAGLVSWVDLNVSSSVAGTPNAYTASIGGNPMIQIYGDSNGTGGVTNMTVSIGTSTTSTYKLYIDAGVSTTAGLGVNGFIKASGYIAGTTTLDIAETYPVDPECDVNGNCPQVGDVVCSAEDTSSTFFIEQCSATSTDRIIGVVSGNPGFILGGYDVKDTKIKGLYPTSFRPIALAGRVPVNVSIANGAIKAGDYLTSSAVPGVAVKAIEPGKSIGMALQSFDGSSSATGIVTVFVNTSWSPGSPVALTETEESAFPDFTKIVLDKFTLTVKNSLRKLGLLVKNGIATVKEVFADKVTTQQLCVGSTCVNESQLQEILNKTQTQAASPVVSPSSQDGAGGVIGVVIESPVVTTTPPIIPVEIETQSTSTPDVTIAPEPVIVNAEITTL